MAKVLIATDKFKGTLSAAEVAAGLADGIRARRPAAQVVVMPLADGGDGLLAALEPIGFYRVGVSATNAEGRVAPTSFARRGPDALVEMAEVAGLAQLADGPAPLTATSRGVGELIAAAIGVGCTGILLGIGGSASIDGGVGMVQALGARVLDTSGREIGAGGAELARAARLELDGLDPLLERISIEIACDVDNPLSGPHGAAVVYGPQKGAGPADVELLDAALSNWADIVKAATGFDHRDDPGAGAAGGVGFAAAAVLGAELRPGAQMMLDLLGFKDHLTDADLVVTGEGALDEQTLRGKAPFAVAAAANASGVPVVAVTGRCGLDARQLRRAGFEAVYTLVDEADAPEQAFDEPTPLLRRIGQRLGERLPDA